MRHINLGKKCPAWLLGEAEIVWDASTARVLDLDQSVTAGLVVKTFQGNQFVLGSIFLMSTANISIRKNNVE